MKSIKIHFRIYIILIIILFSTTLLPKNIKTDQSSTSLIETAFIQNKIDINTWAKMTCLALYNPGELSVKYHSDIKNRNGTMAIKLLQERWHLLTESTKSELSEYGYNMLGIKSRPENLDLYVDTEHFRVHYTVTQDNENAVSIWDYNYNGIPDYIDKITSAFENSWTTEIDSFHFYKPPGDLTIGGSNNLYDVYVLKFSGSDYGLTYGELFTFDNPNSVPVEHNAVTSYIVIRNEYNDFDVGETGSINVTAAHEFFHAIQFGYDQKEERWLMEATAAWIEDEVYDEVNDSRQYISYVTRTPWISLDVDTTQHYYGTWIFFRYISEHHGGTLPIKRIWDKSIAYNSATGNFSWKAVTDGLAESGLQINNVMANFWTSLLLKDNSQYGFEEGAYFSPVNISYNFWSNSSNSYYNFNQNGKSAKYFRFSPALNFGGDDKITIKFIPTNPSSKLSIVFIKQAGSNYTIDKYLMNTGNVTYTIDHSFDYNKINAIVVNNDTLSQNFKIQVISNAKLSKLTEDFNFYNGYLSPKQQYYYPTFSIYYNNEGIEKVTTSINKLNLTGSIGSSIQINGNYQILAGSPDYNDFVILDNDYWGYHNKNYNRIITDDTSHTYSHFENIWSSIVGNNEMVFVGSKLTYNPFTRDNAIWKIDLTSGTTNLVYQFDDQKEYCSDIKGKTENFIFQKITYGSPFKIDIIKNSSSGNSTLLTVTDGQGIRINATSYYNDTFAWIQYVDSIGGQQLKIKDLSLNSIKFEDDESDGYKIDYISLKTSSSGVIWAKAKGTLYNPHFWIYWFDGINTKLIQYTDQFVMQTDADAKRLTLDNYGVAWIELDVYSPTNYIFYYYRFSDQNIYSADLSNYFGREPHLNIKISKDYVVFEVPSNEGVYEAVGTYVMKLEDIISGVKDNPKLTKIMSFELNQNYPNPFNPSTTISYQIPFKSKVNLKIYDILGRQVATLVNKTQAAGNYKVSFNARGFSSGVYFYRLSTENGFSQTKKMILLK